MLKTAEHIFPRSLGNVSMDQRTNSNSKKAQQYTEFTKLVIDQQQLTVHNTVLGDSMCDKGLWRGNPPCRVQVGGHEWHYHQDDNKLQPRGG